MDADQNIANAADPSGSTPINLTASSSTDSNEDLRTRIIGMLAGTLNGGFAELGYHPDYLVQLHTIHEWNTRLREENARLFADNRRLAQLIGMQNQRLTSIAQNGGPNAIIHDLQGRIQEIEMSRRELLRQHEHATHEAITLRTEVNRLSQILQSKGIPYEVENHVPSASSSRMMPQSGVALGHHPGQAQRLRHSQLPPINTAFAPTSTQAAPVHQARRQSSGVPAAYPSPHAYFPFAQPSMNGRRVSGGPTTPAIGHDPREVQRLQAHNASTSSSPRPNIAPTAGMQKHKAVIDLTDEPDSAEGPRAAKRPRLASEPVTNATEAIKVAGPSTPQPQSTFAEVQLANSQAPLVTRTGGSTQPNGDPPASTIGDIQMYSPRQEASRHAPMDDVQHESQALQSAPSMQHQPIEGIQTLAHPESTAGVPSASLPVAEIQQPSQAALNPSTEVIQQCIDENFVDNENGDEAEGEQERNVGDGNRWGLSNKVPEAFPAEASTEDLARHCQEEHPKGWLFLLQRCMEDQESDDDE
ncbi:uncharacterized protein C8Q71DRAFT_860015 [Rhodofomes roseus]|uniref:Uncharacterized protein n=1 Tax=Rhodofomes roseus TaxID=34475 RepID=A0ABQ8K932_9APHY|nr:uncharacterized protein C8Q71DRAFT_860015 [Rhodofomes roseus]KAH9833738.1 hypothetical protein C8Q71DRAFT_860015 [Rhodofomes roseus]